MRNPMIWTVVFVAAAWALGNVEAARTGWAAFAVGLVGAVAASTAALSAHAAKPDNLGAAVADAAGRAALGMVFVFHGLPKVLSMGEGGMMAQPVWLGVGLVELLGGILVVAGPQKLRMLSALGLMATMLVAIIMVHMNNGFSMMRGGFEFQLTLLLVSYGVYVTNGGWCPFKAMSPAMLWGKPSSEA